MKMKEIINLFNSFSTAMKIVLIVIGVLILAGCLFVIVCYAKGVFYIGVRLPDQRQTNSNLDDLYFPKKETEKAKKKKTKKKSRLSEDLRCIINFILKSKIGRFLFPWSDCSVADLSWSDIVVIIIIHLAFPLGGTTFWVLVGIICCPGFVSLGDSISTFVTFFAVELFIMHTLRLASTCP